jgi:hypothetical protein
LMTTATETIANRANAPGSGVFCGRTREFRLPPDVADAPVRRTVGPTWTGGKVADSPGGAGATRGTVAAVADESPFDPPRAALSRLVVEPEGPRALGVASVAWGLATIGTRLVAPGWLGLAGAIGLLDPSAPPGAAIRFTVVDVVLPGFVAPTDSGTPLALPADGGGLTVPVAGRTGPVPVPVGPAMGPAAIGIAGVGVGRVVEALAA